VLSFGGFCFCFVKLWLLNEVMSECFFCIDWCDYSVFDWFDWCFVKMFWFCIVGCCCFNPLWPFTISSLIFYAFLRTLSGLVISEAPSPLIEGVVVSCVH